MVQKQARCPWAEHGELERAYHDEEWGMPVHDDRHLFEMLNLEGQQAGLSWSTILSKRKSFNAAFADFDPARLVDFDEDRVNELMQNPGIIRHRLKIQAVIQNARAYTALVERHGSLDAFLWRYVEGQPVINAWTEMSQVPACTKLSDTLCRDLKKLGFKFVGSTTLYAFMQGVGMVNDHLVSCPCYRRCIEAAG
ncbi:MAG: DNA-3-methyladenine glycosylase I [Puniceicoccales bacterium]